jgi:hypothetical protein
MHRKEFEGSGQVSTQRIAAAKNKTVDGTSFMIAFMERKSLRGQSIQRLRWFPPLPLASTL